jgi:hypothetical protein
MPARFKNLLTAFVLSMSATSAWAHMGHHPNDLAPIPHAVAHALEGNHWGLQALVAIAAVALLAVPLRRIFRR